MYSNSSFDAPTLIHVVTIIIAFFVAFGVFFNKKGTRLHKILGWIFVFCMFVSCVFSFFITTEGSFSLIHILSVITIYWLARAVIAVRFKRENWLRVHIANISSAYIGIWIAGAGVLFRHFVIPGDRSLWPIASGVTAFIAIPIMLKFISKYRNK